MAMRGEGRQVMVSPKSSSPEAGAAVLWWLVELRFEGSAPSAVTFSEPCYFCGNRKRRCLLPPTRPRKRRLIYVFASSPTFPSSPAASTHLPIASSPLALQRSNSSSPFSGNEESAATELSLAVLPTSPTESFSFRTSPSAISFSPLLEQPAEISPKPICCSASLHHFIEQVTLMPQQELLPALLEKSNSPSSANSSSPAPREMHCAQDKESNRAMADGNEPLSPSPNKEDEVKTCITCPRCGIINVVVLRHI